MKIINIQNLALIDRAINGKKIILLEFLGAVLFCFGLGLYIIIPAKNAGTLWIGWGILGIGFNYVPLLIYGVLKKSKFPPNPELLSVESKKQYTKQSLFLIVPFVVLIIASIQFFKKKLIKMKLLLYELKYIKLTCGFALLGARDKR